MSRPAAKSITFNRRLRSTWIVEGMRLLGEGIAKEAWVKRMTEVISSEISGENSITKSMRYLRHIWVEPGEQDVLRREAIQLYHESSDATRDRVIAWGMASATYPFLFEVAMTTCRMLRVQPEMKLEQLLRKLCEIYGEKETVRRSGRYSLGLIVELGLLQKAGKAGQYQSVPPVKIADSALAAWLLRCWQSASNTEGPIDRMALASHPGLGFFNGAELIDAAVLEEVVKIERLSLATEVILFEQKSKELTKG